MSRDSLIVRALEQLDIPTDTGGGIVHIELCGNREVFVENHKGILELGENEVLLNSGKGRVRITGQNLAVLAMNRDEIRLAGKIESVSFVV